MQQISESIPFEPETEFMIGKMRFIVTAHYDDTQEQARDKEINRLYEKIYEDQALGRLPEERFLMLASKYDDEQAALRQRIRYLQKIVAEEKGHEMNADGFLALVRRYTADFPELTPEIVQEFIDKVIVHHREKSRAS